MKKYFLPLMMLGIFETVAVTLWLAQDNCLSGQSCVLQIHMPDYNILETHELFFAAPHSM